ncbi:hypothetical protein AX16_005151 [Volvariella volvacea WC 439]|nr:hypothetical protein AX16_005151 [Volvariella volvacea WC 439]
MPGIRITDSSTPSKGLPIAQFASYNSRSQGDPNCADGTRTRHIKDFLNFVERPKSSPVVILITGSVGTGKTALACHLVHLARGKRYIVGNFFFSAFDKERNNLKLVVTTIAYQLSVLDGELRGKITEVINSDATILTAATRYQWEALIIKPLEEAEQKSKIAAKTIIVFDGLDTCSWEEQCQIMKLVKSTTLPITFLISSRPQKDVDDYFPLSSADHPSTNYRVINLSNDPDSRSDVLSVVRNRFTTLQGHEHEDLVNLVESQFSILDSYSRNPSSPFADVDKEYCLIVLRAMDNGDLYTIGAVLYHLVHLGNPNSDNTIDIIARFWGRTPQDIRIALHHLFAVIDIPHGNNDPISIRNRSFFTFIQTRISCQQFGRIIHRLSHDAFIRSISLAKGLLISPRLVFPPYIYTNWIDIGPRLVSNSEINPRDLKNLLRAFPFQPWRRCWEELFEEDLPNGEAFRAWIKGISTVRTTS